MLGFYFQARLDLRASLGLEEILGNMMSNVRWELDYEVGDQTLDRQHRHLVKMINRFMDLSGEMPDAEKISDLLNALGEHISEHFEYEEHFMREMAYPGLEKHRKKHREFRKRYVELCMDVIEGRAGMQKQLISYLTEWWQQHVCKEDMAYAKFKKAQE